MAERPRNRRSVHPAAVDGSINPSREAGPPEHPASPPVHVVRVRDLMGPSNEVRLLHDGIEYRLRVTKLGKLILTK